MQESRRPSLSAAFCYTGDALLQPAAGGGLSGERGLFFMVVGPAGAGKNTLMNDALQRLPWLKHLATCTTRSPRPGEVEAGDYHFVSLPRFRQMIADDELLEWQEVHPGRFYGVPRAAVERALAAGQHLIADLDVLGATCLQLRFPTSAVPLFVQPPDQGELVARMHGRGDSDADIQSRLRRVQLELQFAGLADYRILNDDRVAAVDRLCELLDWRQRQHRDDPDRYQRRHFLAQLLVSDGTRALLPAGRRQLPARSLLPGELPHDAALRCLADVPHPGPGQLHNAFGHAGSFLPPAAVEVDRSLYRHEARLTWVYHPVAAAPAPPGWRWLPLTEIPLPAPLLHWSGAGQLASPPA